MQAYTCDRREYKVSVSTRGLSAYTANRDYHFQYSQRRDWYTPLSNLGSGQTPAGANKQTEKQDSYLPAYSVRSYNKHAQNEIEENTWMEKNGHRPQQLQRLYSLHSSQQSAGEATHLCPESRLKPRHPQGSSEYANNLKFHSCFRAGHSDGLNHPCYGTWRKRRWHPLKYICEEINWNYVICTR